ncbi:MAG: excinuclease ABC subunit UvrC [Pseudomonadota bacterium]
MPDTHTKTTISLERGQQVIRDTAKRLPDTPGVYRMVNSHDDVLYVGKARSLKKRVVTYSHVNKLPNRLRRMVAETIRMEIVTTHTEVEALLLESNLIKKFRPRFNILLRDDKSFPFIQLTGDHDFPQIRKHRGGRSRPGDYYGPFASAGTVDRTIAALQRAFLLRNCSDHVFNARTRPCLQYHIKRCSAPCVDFASKEEYAEQVALAKAFLSGESRAAQDQFAQAMEAASERLEFEVAARYRDRIRALTAIQSKQEINIQGLGDADIHALHQQGGETCIQVFFFRSGQNYGNRSYFPAHAGDDSTADILAAFVAQFYDNKPAPKTLLLSEKPTDMGLLGEALSLRAGYKVAINAPQRGEKRSLVDRAMHNAKDALARRQAESASQRKLLDGLAELLDLDAQPQRIEVYDNSHIGGTDAVGGMIVAGPEGFIKNSYRKFNIKSEDIEPGDDYGMMREVMQRRFSRAQKEDPERTQGQWPDLVIIDGGLGQLNVVIEALNELGITDLPLVSVAKGPDRNAGREKFFRPDTEPFQLPINDPVLFYVQRLRDEAHRFAIGSHRARREKKISASPLDGIPGIGPGRKRALLLHFGSARSVKRAGLSDLEAVDGISKNVAKKIYDHFHGHPEV